MHEAEVQHRHEALPPREELRAAVVAGEERDRLVDALGSCVVEGRRLHGAGGDSGSGSDGGGTDRRTRFEPKRRRVRNLGDDRVRPGRQRRRSLVGSLSVVSGSVPVRNPLLVRTPGNPAEERSDEGPNQPGQQADPRNYHESEQPSQHRRFLSLDQYLDLRHVLTCGYMLQPGFDSSPDRSPWPDPPFRVPPGLRCSGRGSLHDLLFRSHLGALHALSFSRRARFRVSLILIHLWRPSLARLGRFRAVRSTSAQVLSLLATAHRLFSTRRYSAARRLPPPCVRSRAGTRESCS